MSITQVQRRLRCRLLLVLQRLQHNHPREREQFGTGTVCRQVRTHAATAAVPQN